MDQAATELVRWGESFQKATDEDPELDAHGKYYTCSYLLDMQEHSVLVKMHAGKTEEIVFDPGQMDERYQFAIRASSDTWSKMAQPIPPPMYHGIWAATFRAGMRLEGDLLVMMQNLRCLTRQLELLRQTGVPLGGEDRS
jgi:hypothetical protein